MTPIAELRHLQASYPTELGQRVVNYIYGPFGPQTAYKVLTLTRAFLATQIKGFRTGEADGDWLADGRDLCESEIRFAEEEHRRYINAFVAQELRRNVQAMLTPEGLLGLAAALWASNRKHEKACALARHEQQAA